MIVIVDYGMGNIGSIINMLKKIGVPALVSSNVKEIKQADKLVLPGVGSFDTAVKNLRQKDLIGVLNEKAIEQKVPVIGLCLGMQLFTEGSEEGSLPGLGWVRGKTIKFAFDPKIENLRIPHMGWNTTRVARTGALFKGLEDEARFYFVHSFHVECSDQADVLAYTNYGYDFCSSLQHGNVMGAQFHPEKSHRFGLRLLHNFVHYSGTSPVLRPDQKHSEHTTLHTP